MPNKQPLTIEENLYLIDGFDLGMPGRTGTYVMREEQLTLLETGPSPSVPRILQGLADLGLEPADVKYIIVTHIHLDHAGGAGLLLKSCPNATVVVHPRGARHLVNPTKLIAGARAVYGESFDDLFEPIVPIPEGRILIKEDGTTLAIGPNCTLQFIDTPGHAKHHFTVYDPARKAIFTGDTAGIRYHQTEDLGFTFYLPSTSPNQFDPAAMLASIERVREIGPNEIFFGHFGQTDDVEEVLRQVTDWIPRFVETGKQTLADGGNAEQVGNALLSMVGEYLAERNVPSDHEVYRILRLDMRVCAMGIVDYLQKKG